MSIPNVNGPARVAPPTDHPTPAVATRPSAVSTEAEAAAVDPHTQQPPPLRFPWLSRLQQLESAAGQRPSFEAAPVLGDLVNRAA